MNRFISNDAHTIERLLNAGRQPISDQRGDIIVDVFAGLLQFNTKLLNGKTKEARSGSRRP